MTGNGPFTDYWKKNCSSRNICFPVRVDPLLVRKKKAEIMKVVLLCQMAGKHGGVPTHRNCQARTDPGQSASSVETFLLTYPVSFMNEIIFNRSMMCEILYLLHLTSLAV